MFSFAPFNIAKNSSSLLEMTGSCRDVRWVFLKNGVVYHPGVRTTDRDREDRV